MFARNEPGDPPDRGDEELAVVHHHDDEELAAAHHHDSEPLAVSVPAPAEQREPDINGSPVGQKCHPENSPPRWAVGVSAVGTLLIGLAALITATVPSEVIDGVWQFWIR